MHMSSEETEKVRITITGGHIRSASPHARIEGLTGIIATHLWASSIVQVSVLQDTCIKTG